MDQQIYGNISYVAWVPVVMVLFPNGGIALSHVDPGGVPPEIRWLVCSLMQKSDFSIKDNSILRK